MEVSGPDRFTRGKEPGVHCILGWVGPGADVHVLEKKRIFVLDPMMTFFMNL